MTSVCFDSVECAGLMAHAGIGGSSSDSPVGRKLIFKVVELFSAIGGIADARVNDAQLAGDNGAELTEAMLLWNFPDIG